MKILNNEFFSNSNNKKNSIVILSTAFNEAGIITKTAEENADLLIVKTAIEHSDENNKTAIIGQDKNLLVIITHYAPNNSNIFLYSPGRNSYKPKLFSPDSFKFSEVKKLVSFAHAFCSGDTTSAFAGIGKNKIIKLLNRNEKLKDIAIYFYNKDDDK